MHSYTSYIAECISLASQAPIHLHKTSEKKWDGPRYDTRVYIKSFILLLIVSDDLQKQVQANATAYYGSVPIDAESGTKVFCFQILINLGHFYNDLDAIVITLVRSNLVQSIFSLSDGQTTREFSIASQGGIDAVNASHVFPEIRLIGDRHVVYNDCVIYSNVPPADLTLPVTLSFDLNIIVVGRGSEPIEELLPFAVGTVTLTLPLDPFQNISSANTTISLFEENNFGDFDCFQLDGCEPNPCQNDAVCTNNVYFECFCNSRWMDEQCDPIIQHCASDNIGSVQDPCDKDAIRDIGCPDESTMYSCTCTVGFTGYNCSEDIDECKSSQCQNGAICLNLLNGSFECICPIGWTGSLCETDIDYCTSNSSPHGPCDRTGASGCTDGNSTYHCSCIAGFTGHNCSEKIDECEPNPCQNGAQCSNHQFGQFECHCYPGWTGPLCDMDINYCASDNSTHGPCDLVGASGCEDENSTYACTCAPGFTGYDCSEDIDECELNPCQNGAICINLLHGSFHCLCPIGWTGELCETDIDYCAPDSSLHGPCHDTGATNCTDGNSTYSCTCAVGYTGYNCSEDVDECVPNPCQNGGKCTNLMNGAYECECPHEFSGETCNSFVDACAPSGPSACTSELECTRGMYNCKCLCIFQCPLFTFGNHSAGYCQSCKSIVPVRYRFCLSCLILVMCSDHCLVSLQTLYFLKFLSAMVSL